jgi:hypothetical protein
MVASVLMNSAVKVIGSILAITTILVLGFLAWARHEVRKNGEKVRIEYEQGLARILPAFLEDQELAKAYPIFATPRNERDAGPFLNPRIGWDGDHKRIERWRATVPSPSTLLALDPKLIERIPKDWWTADRALWSTLDFSWMTSLREFDHWDVERNSPWAELAAGEWPNSFPLLFEVAPWSKLRLAKGLAEGQMKDAVADVEHLSRLLLSTETLLGAAGAFQQLDLVDRALAALETSGKPAPRAANRVDGVTRRRLQRAVTAALAFMRIDTPREYDALRPRIRVGRCAAMNEALQAAVVFRPMAGRSRLDGLRRLEDLLNGETACRLTRVRRQWADITAAKPIRLSDSCGRSRDYPLSAACRALANLVPAGMLLAFTEDTLTQMVLASDTAFPGYSEKGAAPCKP